MAQVYIWAKVSLYQGETFSPFAPTQTRNPLSALFAADPTAAENHSMTNRPTSSKPSHRTRTEITPAHKRTIDIEYFGAE